MTPTESNHMAQKSHSPKDTTHSTDEASATKGHNTLMRRQEVKVDALLKLVQHDYIDNHKKSKATLDVHIEKHLLPFFAGRSAERLRPSDIQAYKDHRRAEGARNSTVNLELAALRRAYSLGNERELVVNRPVIKLYNVGKQNRRLGFFEPEEFTKMVAVLPPYAKQVLRFGYQCGWRENEIFRLHWEDDSQGSGYYDEAGCTVRLYDSKSGHGRVLPLLNELGELTEAGLVIEAQKLNRVKPCPYIFHFHGKLISRTTFNKHWRKACTDSGVNRHFHDLRRTVVRNLTRAGVPRVIAKTITGHETDDVFERYDIVDERDIKDGLSKLHTYLKTRKNDDNNGGGTTSDQSNENIPPTSQVPSVSNSSGLAERAGFEPACPLPDNTISSPVTLPNVIKRFINLFRW